MYPASASCMFLAASDANAVCLPGKSCSVSFWDLIVEFEEGCEIFFLYLSLIVDKLIAIPIYSQYLMNGIPWVVIDL